MFFQPEGVEDLAVFNAQNQLVEAVQVKSFSYNITLSHLVSANPEGSFFHRAVSLMHGERTPIVTLASFGPVGQELQQAVAGEKQAHGRVVQKLVDSHGFAGDEAIAVLKALKIETLDEDLLSEQVLERLKVAVTGADPEASFDLLNHWLYGCAERKTVLSHQDVVDRINRIGRFVSERTAHHLVWFTSVVPIESRMLESGEQETLKFDFYRGVAARYDHILADVDVARPEKIELITAAFAERNTVILHSASGQGKSTLAFRYIHQELSEAWRYQVRMVDGRSEALVIAAALEGYASALGEPVVVFIDVTPRDVGWPELIEQLALNRLIRVIVAIREEDWRQAKFVDTDAFREVELSFDQVEAEQIYSSLVGSDLPKTLLDFEDAWNKFGQSGPLLEFVYLITQGGLLRDRLSGQVAKLKRDANRGNRGSEELELLRLVAVASAFGARLSIKSLASFLSLPALDEAINLLEDEYLFGVPKAAPSLKDCIRFAPAS
jgi:hypothetical protein